MPFGDWGGKTNDGASLYGLPPDLLYKIHLLPCFRTHLRTTKVRPRFTPHRRRPALLSAYSPHAISAISAMSASSFASSAREATARSLG